MNMIGYARVSTGDQNTAAQVEKLLAAGCTAIYKENASGGRWDRPELHKLLDRIGNDDVLWFGSWIGCPDRLATYCTS